MDEAMRVGSAPVQAFVIVDAQRGFLEGEQAVVGASGLVDRLCELAVRARGAGALVVHLQNDGPVGALDEPGRPGWALHPRIVSGARETVIRKSDDDGFEGTGLGELLDSRGVRRVVIGGLLSEMCVSATARTALVRGFDVVLPRDAHATYDLDDIPAAVVARVAEHALGDEVEVVASVSEVAFGEAEAVV
ncbi:isochorismatase family protein [Streptosporangium sp. CA-135522]|uniref:isochorismatase family protein n=1 Tax=Streptosporangium sp. CA-135522 TaxID=3240072 RepID=UPI003D932D35